MNDTSDLKHSSEPAARGRRSGSRAALLSFLFPGVGQLYLRHLRAALVLSVPVVIVVGALVMLFTQRSWQYRLVDPNVTLSVMVVVVALGAWWVVGILHAARSGDRTGGNATLVAAILVLALVVVEGFGVVQLWRVRAASEHIFAGNPLDETPPPATPSPSPSPPSWTPDPQATPTQRPPDYVDPSDDPPDPEPTIEPGPTPGYDMTQIDATNDGLLNVLLVGLDWQPGRDSKRTDTMLVVSADAASGEVLMFSFPRDTARFPIYTGGTYSGRLNTFANYANRHKDLYPQGGLRALAYEIGFLLGVPIDYYASVNMPGFISVVELAGGVDVCNTRLISDGQLQFILKPGMHHLSAADALRYVRSRHGSGGDFGRNQRQQQVLAALRKELLRPANVARLPDIVEALSGVINTDFPPEQVDQLLALADEVEEQPSQSWIFGYPRWAIHLPKSETGGQSVQFLRLDKIGALSVRLFGDKSLYFGEVAPESAPPEASPTPTNAPSPTPNVCGA